MPLIALAQSRYVFTAITMDSVPPDVAVHKSKSDSLSHM
jgi:hypothetical protein